jgi:hypothetical protein
VLDRKYALLQDLLNVIQANIHNTGGRDDPGPKPVIANGMRALAHLFDVVANIRCIDIHGENKKQGMVKRCRNGSTIYAFHCRPPVMVNDFTRSPALHISRHMQVTTLTRTTNEQWALQQHSETTSCPCIKFVTSGCTVPAY